MKNDNREQAIAAFKAMADIPIPQERPAAFCLKAGEWLLRWPGRLEVKVRLAKYCNDIDEDEYFEMLHG